jgi:hypothetical protein
MPANIRFFAASALFLSVCLPGNLQAQSQVKVGTLSCTFDDSSGWGFKSLNCTFAGLDGSQIESYSGVTPSLDLHIDAGPGTMKWTVYAPAKLAPKGLVGKYDRKESTTVPVYEKGTGEFGGNALVGGPTRRVALQPSAMTPNGNALSAKLNLAVAVTTLELTSPPPSKFLDLKGDQLKN